LWQASPWGFKDKGIIFVAIAEIGALLFYVVVCVRMIA
jgi:hypothetical protein